MLKIGHRGSPGYPRYGENTIASFALALAVGADAIELDVRRSKDGKLVVIHDSSVDRTTNGSGLVSNFTYQELREFDAGRGCHIPLLENVLDIFGQNCLINVETKELGLMNEVADMATAKKSNILVSTFDADDNDQGSSSSWSEFGCLTGKVPIGLLATHQKIVKLGWENFLKTAKEYRATAINPEGSFALSNPEIIGKAHKKGLSVFVWTVNSQTDSKFLKYLKIDGIFSDLPEILAMS